MRKLRHAICVIVSLLVVLTLTAAKCKGESHTTPPRQPTPNDVHHPNEPRAPDPHAGDPQPSDHKERIITVHVRVGTKEQLPATVYISTVGGQVRPPGITDVIADTHRVTYTLTFEANASTQLSVLVSLITSTGGNASFCSMEAGAYGNDGPRFTSGETHVNCHLLIKRLA